VRPLSGVGVADSLKDSITLLLDVDELTLEELWAAREAIELPTVGMAAQRRTERHLAAMLGTIESDEYKKFDVYFPDITFHRAIADASQNRLMSVFMLSIHLTLRTLAERYFLPEAKEVSQEQHHRIYEAIMEKDEALARARMEEHLRMAYEVYRRAVPRKELSEDGSRSAAS